MQSKKHMHHNQSASFTQTRNDLKALQYNKKMLHQNAPNEVESADYNSQLPREEVIRGTAKSERIKQGGVEEDSKQSFVISQNSGFQYSDEVVALR